jgi:uncharacterized membrane protein YhaH (DUF805 family)
VAGYWFRRKRHGWGWTPASRQGWVVVVALVVVVTVAGTFLGEDASSGAVLAYLVLVALAVIVLVLVATATGPRPRWGRSPDDDPDEDA